MNFPSVHEGGRKRGERTKAPWSSPSLYIPRSLYFHTPISLPLDRQFHFSIPLSSSRACTNEACNCTGLPCTGEKNIVIRQGLFADRGGGGGGRTRIEIEWEVALFPRIPCSPPPSYGEGRLQCQWKRPIGGVFTGSEEIPFRIERRSNELGGRHGPVNESKFGDFFFHVRKKSWEKVRLQLGRILRFVEFVLAIRFNKEKKRNSIRKSSEGRT